MIWVSILVLVDAALRHLLYYQSQPHQHVSILVLVDAALRLGISVSSGVTRLGFNPCFSGCCSATGSTLGILILLSTNVSILVLVDAALRLETVTYADSEIMFQSLF